VWLCALSETAAAQATGAAARLSAAAAVQAPSAARAAEVQAALQGLDIGEAEAGLRKARAAPPLWPQPLLLSSVSMATEFGLHFFNSFSAALHCMRFSFGKT